jgi:hypothetical protein
MFFEIMELKRSYACTFALVDYNEQTNHLQNIPLFPPEKQKVMITFQLRLNHISYPFNVVSVQRTTALKPKLTHINNLLALNLCSNSGQ